MIERAPYDRAHPYTRISNKLLTDVRFNQHGPAGLRAFRVLAYLLSKPDHWVIRRDDLVKQGFGGATACSQALTLLTELGYLERVQTNTKTGMETSYTIHEVPLQVQPTSASANTGVSEQDGYTAEPMSGIANTGYPASGNANMGLTSANVGARVRDREHVVKNEFPRTHSSSTSDTQWADASNNEQRPTTGFRITMTSRNGRIPGVKNLELYEKAQGFVRKGILSQDEFDQMLASGTFQD